jgi:hypothetical protein
VSTSPVFPLVGVCHDCRLHHPCATPQAVEDWEGRHVGHRLQRIPRATTEMALDLRLMDRIRARLAHALAPRGSWLHAVRAYDPNADVKLALQAAQSMTVTSLASLASSATAGWQSAVVDNTSNLYLDALLMIVLDFANTAPANSKGVYVLAYHGLETGTYTNPASGSEGTITLTDVTANPQPMPLAGFLPYNTADEVAESRAMSIAATAGGLLPPYWGVALMNHSGAALAASGHTVKHRGVYSTVV